MSQKIQSRNSVDSSGSSPQTGKYMQNSSSLSGPCQISNDSGSPERPLAETSFSVPLHPTKRPASNPPPISNQATKGNITLCTSCVFLTVAVGERGSLMHWTVQGAQCVRVTVGTEGPRVAVGRRQFLRRMIRVSQAE